ncbi:MAG: hypothetical protein ACRD15_15030 [Vicinamibacterales bacterium]
MAITPLSDRRQDARVGRHAGGVALDMDYRHRTDGGSWTLKKA